MGQKLYFVESKWNTDKVIFSTAAFRPSPR